MYIDVMLAKKPSQIKGFAVTPGRYAAELKYDGHRMETLIRPGRADLLSEGANHAVGWSRNGLQQLLPKHLQDDLGQMPSMRLDGERWVPGKRCYGVKDLDHAGDLVYVVFDVLEVQTITGWESTMDWTYKHRRLLLEDLFKDPRVKALKSVKLSETFVVNNEEDVNDLRDRVFGEGGEGVMLKEWTSTYQPKKRSKHWVKIKKEDHAVLTVVELLPSSPNSDTIHPYGRVRLVDDEGRETTVKTKNDYWRAEFLKDHKRFIGRRLVIAFTEMTEDGAYREPRWFAWEDEL